MAMLKRQRLPPPEDSPQPTKHAEALEVPPPPPSEADKPEPEAAALEVAPPQPSEADKAEPEAAQRDWRLELFVEKERAKIEWIGKFGIGVCSKCRWRSGCMQCDYEKAIRYHMHKANFICRDW